MKKLKQFIHSGTMVTLVWVLGIAAVWEGFAFYVAQTKRTPLNVLPHLWQIIGSFFSDKMHTTTAQICVPAVRCPLRHWRRAWPSTTPR